MTERLQAAASVTGVVLLAVLAGVGAVALVAEWRGDWGSYFVMERTVAAVTPVAAALAAVAIASGFVVVYLAS